MALAAPSQMLFGQPLPGDWVGWLVLLIGIWSGMGVCQAAVAAFIDQNRKQPVAPRLSGYILPGGWIVWGGLWVYAVDQTIDFKSEEKSA